MPKLKDVKLEILRPGPPHNQLLSPLTPYMAICGEASPTTFHIEMEHRQLLNHLEHLRYVTVDGDAGPVGIPERLRGAKVQELGEEIAAIFGKIQSLNAEISRTQCDCDGDDPSGSGMLHLRLVLSGSELALIPFELAIAPEAFPGEWRNLFLQTTQPITVTREIRRRSGWANRWKAEPPPRVLFVWAEPAGMTVPHERHLDALRNAISPWVAWSPRADRVLANVKERLRVLPDASIEGIRDLCASERFTHVHVLAHGHPYDEAGEQRFGLALAKRDRPGEKDVVDGRRLAKALQTESADGVRRSQPLVVTLATCDSGAQTSVLVPGGSIAHDLHSEGIPWVFASQFPLTKVGSVRMTETLYPRLLRGDDPRQILFELRRQLYMTADHDHDWASLVAYASYDRDFSASVNRFFERQARLAINTGFKTLEELDGAGESLTTDVIPERVRAASDAILHCLEIWRERLPDGGSDAATRAQRAECFGMHGAAYKRLALLPDGVSGGRDYRTTMREALGWYRRAMESDPLDHWTATQYLSLTAVLAEGSDLTTFLWTLRHAEMQLEAKDSETRAWARGTLAELELLRSYHDPKGKDSNIPRIGDKIRAVCVEIVQLRGADSFEAHSTRRQFRRYLDRWAPDQPNPQIRKAWHDLAEIALKALTPPGHATGE